MTRTCPGSLRISLDLSLGQGRERAIPRGTLRRLVTPLNDRQIPWSIAASDPELLSGLEVAGDLDITLVAEGGRSADACMESIRQVSERFAACGFTAHSVRFASSPVEISCEELRHWNITVVRGTPGIPLARYQPERAAMLRHGVYYLPATAAVPGYGRFLGCLDMVFRAKQALHRSWFRQTSEQIVVDATRMGPRTEKAWVSLLTTVAKARDLGRMACESLTQAYARRTPVRSLSSQQSILRRAA